MVLIPTSRSTPHSPPPARPPVRRPVSHLDLEPPEPRPAEDECEVVPEEPLLVSQLRCELRCWERGVGFRRRLFGRQIRNTVRRLPDWFVALAITTHLLVVPVAIRGVELLKPTVEVRLADRAVRDVRQSTFEAIWGLVEAMHYSPTSASGDERWERWGDRLGEAIGGEEPSMRSAVRSEVAFGSLASRLLTALDDPYSLYAGPDTLAALPPALPARSSASLPAGLSVRPHSADGAGERLYAVGHYSGSLHHAPPPPSTPPPSREAASAVLAPSLLPLPSPPSSPLISPPLPPPPPRLPSGGLLVHAVLPDSPAERAGLRPGDRLLRIGGIDEPPAALPAEALRSALEVPCRRQ